MANVAGAEAEEDEDLANEKTDACKCSLKRTTIFTLVRTIFEQNLSVASKLSPVPYRFATILRRLLCSASSAGRGSRSCMAPVTPLPVGPGQESVWSYPRPAIAQPTSLPLRVECGGVTIAATTAAVRTLETSHPPSYYFPQADVNMSHLRRSSRSSFCEWKGSATYYDVIVGDRVEADAAWSYPQPTPPFASLKDHIAFYPGRMDACFVGDERVTPQPGSFYGGWIHSGVVGPFKGVPGSSFW